MADTSESGDPQAKAEKVAEAAKRLEIKSAVASKVDDEFEDEIDVTSDSEASFSDSAKAVAESLEGADDANEEVLDDTIGDEDTAPDAVELAGQPDDPDPGSGDKGSDLPDDVIDIPGKDVSAPVEAIAVPPPPVQPRRSGVGGIVLGALIAAAIGVGAMYYGHQQGWLGAATDTSDLQAKIDGQATEIEALKSALLAATETDTTQNLAIDALQSATPDLTPLQTAVETLGTTDKATTTALEELTASLSETRTRLGALEVQPIPVAELPAEVVTAYETQLADVLATIDTRFTAMQKEQSTFVGKLESDIRAELAALQAAQAEAALAEAEAAKAAKVAEARAALATISAALDTGTGFAASLASFQGNSDLTVPDALVTAAPDGAKSLENLMKEFPEAARAALAAAPRGTGEESEIGPITSIILTQLGARSLTPREGNDPDAVLSRAEAAVANGDLETALGELAALPDAAQQPFADWVASATTLREAKAAAAELSAQLNSQ